jgi:hypothetical protein
MHRHGIQGMVAVVFSVATLTVGAKHPSVIGVGKLFSRVKGTIQGAG